MLQIVGVGLPRLLRATGVALLASAGLSGGAEPPAVAGRLKVEALFNEVTLIPVTMVQTEPTFKYSTGDAFTADGRTVGVRIGTHVGTVSSGELWRFPLKSGTSGSAQVRFDGEVADGSITWSVVNERMIDASVVVPRSVGLFQQAG